MSAARASAPKGKSAPARRPPSAAEVAGGPLPPVVLLVGEEEYLLEECFRTFWENTVDPAMADFNRDLFHADEVSREDLFALAASFPMMAERRLVVLRRLEKAPAALLNDLAVYLERPSPSTCLLLLAASVDKRRKVWAKVAELGSVHEFQPLGPEPMARWLEDACAGRGCRLPGPLAQQLAELLGPVPLRMAAQEVEKLCLLAGPAGEVGEAELATALGMEPDAKPFDLVDAVLARRSGRAQAILQSVLRQPDAAFTLTGLFGKSLGRLWFLRRLRDQRLDEKEISLRLGQPDWLVRKSLPQLQAWNVAQIEAGMEVILKTDMGIKGDNPLPPAQQLTQMVVDLCRL